MGQGIKTSQERIARQLEELWSYSPQVAKAGRQQTPPDFNDTDPENVRQNIQSIIQALRDKEVDPKVKQKLNYAAKNWPAKLEPWLFPACRQAAAHFSAIGKLGDPAA